MVGFHLRHAWSPEAHHAAAGRLGSPSGGELLLSAMSEASADGAGRVGTRARHRTVRISSRSRGGGPPRPQGASPSVIRGARHAAHDRSRHPLGEMDAGVRPVAARHDPARIARRGAGRTLRRAGVSLPPPGGRGRVDVRAGGRGTHAWSPAYSAPAMDVPAGRGARGRRGRRGPHVQVRISPPLIGLAMSYEGRIERERP